MLSFSCCKNLKMKLLVFLGVFSLLIMYILRTPINININVNSTPVPYPASYSSTGENSVRNSDTGENSVSYSDAVTNPVRDSDIVENSVGINCADKNPAKYGDTFKSNANYSDALTNTNDALKNSISVMNETPVETSDEVDTDNSTTASNNTCIISTDGAIKGVCLFNFVNYNNSIV